MNFLSGFFMVFSDFSLFFSSDFSFFFLQVPQPQQQPQQIPRTQFQYMPSGSGSTVNSIPPSRDPKTGATANLPQIAVQPHGSQVGTPTGMTGIPQQPQPHLPTAQPTVVSAVSTVLPAAAGSQVPQQQNPQPQAYLASATRDSHPIASEELVERLEEISTQQGSPDAAEDPER